MRILHLLAPAGVGGLETVVRALAAGHAMRGHEVAVAGILDTATEDHPFGRALEGDGAEFLPLPLPGRRYGAERRAVAGLLAALRPHVLHTHGYRPDVLDSPVARGRGVASVTTVHGFAGHGLRNRVYEWLQVRAFRRFDAVVPVSEKLGRELRRAGVAASRIHVIRNAWVPSEKVWDRAEAREILGLPRKARVVGWVGRLTPEKDLGTLLQAFALLRTPGVLLSLIGAGPEEPHLKAMAERLGISERVQWHGVVPEARMLFSAFDLFALTSRSEGTPMVLLEAMAAEVPIVTTEVGGIPDVLSPQDALLVAPEHPMAVAEALDAVILEPEEAAERVRRARRRLEAEFAVDPWLDRYEEVYASVGPSAP